jgi:hypothetical protein
VVCILNLALYIWATECINLWAVEATNKANTVEKRRTTSDGLSFRGGDDTTWSMTGAIDV